ncbi:MAG: hypothetical protein HN952_06705 [Candidatus Cloacimonetes bacterium]|jgi:hypothetical protein|nr:hypothetical protein [Candidatus Cloacimonadota bacterium]MBT6994624.1 hypothetical protein [Candidatus Cloacimonadota bacterium]MBT7469717.1 hypothetical protein [Candidatus Cloacimonadota bacterium]
MENKYLRDFVVAAVVILIIAFGIKDYYLFMETIDIPTESVYAKSALSENLLKQIQNIENSIKNRKKFRFTVTKDPLEQNLIVKTRQDLEKQWRAEIESMIRLESTIIPKNGDKLASISYDGKTTLYKIGDSFENGKITDIQKGKITYLYKGTTGVLKVKPLPPKPVAIKSKKTKKNRELNW